MEQYRLGFEPAHQAQPLVPLDRAVREQVVALMAAVLEAIHKTRVARGRGARSEERG